MLDRNYNHDKLFRKLHNMFDRRLQSMRRKIAQLDVYVDPESPDPAVTTGVAGGNDSYSIVLNKGSEPLQINNLEKLQTVLAHELGHFISRLTKDETHNPLASILFNMTGESEYIIPAEEKAWQLARRMGVPIDEPFAKAAMETYKNGFSFCGTVGRPACPPDPKDFAAYMAWGRSEDEIAQPPNCPNCYRDWFNLTTLNYLEQIDPRIQVNDDRIHKMNVVSFEDAIARQQAKWFAPELGELSL